jgi:hypothetical protein
MPSKSSNAAPALSVGTSAAAQPAASGKAETPESPIDGIARLQSQVDALDSLDRAALAKSILGDNDHDFPGRSRWEDKLFSAKQTFVAQNREVLQQLSMVETVAEGVKNVQDMNDPRVKAINAKLQDLVQQTQQNAVAFKAVMEEGKALAARTGQ